jgi:hypothetical protein
MSLTDKVTVELEIGTFATLIAGLYCTYSAVNPMAIPEYLWLEVATKIAPYLDEIESFDEWIKYNLLIIPKELCSDEDIESYKKNTEYFERANGNAILVVTFEV